MKPKRGRPKLPNGEAKAKYLHLRLTKTEMDSIETHAKASGSNISKWARDRLLALINSVSY